MQISIYVKNNMPEPGRNLAADACMGRTQLSPCIYNFSTRTIRASRNAMPAWYFFHAEPLISRFSLEKYITLLQQLWQTVLMWNLYPIFISLNQLAVKITPAESFLWMHLHQFQYLFYNDFRLIFLTRPNYPIIKIQKAHWSEMTFLTIVIKFVAQFFPTTGQRKRYLFCWPTVDVLIYLSVSA